jgi:uncharacterized protein (TIGR02284 family)
METSDKYIVCVINDLIEINSDRIEGYDNAFKETKETDLKNVFSEMAANSRKLKEELIPIVLKYNGKLEKGTPPTGKIYRVWMDIKSALTGKNRKEILSSCEYGEDMANKAYELALKNEILPSEIFTIIEKQKALLKIDHDKIKSMRDLTIAE